MHDSNADTPPHHSAVHDNLQNEVHSPTLLPSGPLRTSFTANSHNDNELLLDTYKRRPPKFFKLGKVFMVLWTEPLPGSISSTSDQSITEARFGELVFSKVRRFVVIREGSGYCLCVPIYTYNHQGVGKRGVKKSEHAIIYTGQAPPSQLHTENAVGDESPMLPKPIRVDPDTPDDQLHPLSRIDIGKIYTIQHDIKVKPFGVVNPSSILTLMDYRNAVFFPDETMPNIQPCFTVPYPRNPDFVEPKPLMEKLEQQLHLPGARVALVGLGGVGKTHIAIEYCYRLRELSPETWILWIQASNSTRFDQSIRNIAALLDVCKPSKETADVYLLVYNWLVNARNGKWIIVLDNADDIDLLREPLSQDKGKKIDGGARARIDYIPVCSHGSLILTSRSWKVAEILADRRDILLMRPMEEETALALLENKLGRESSDVMSRKLVATLEYMPLAIAQAAAFIRSREPRYSIEQYVDSLENELHMSSLLLRDVGNRHRNITASNSILTTWMYSFEHIASSRPSAADLLSLTSFYDCRNIPELLLLAAGGSQTTGCSVDDSLEDDIVTLRDFSFISVTSSGRAFSMHRLVQVATQQWLKSRGQLMRWAEQSVKNLSTVFPANTFENLPTCQELYPHAKLVLSRRLDERDARICRSTLLYNAGRFAQAQGFLPEAEAFASECVKERHDLFGSQNEETFLGKKLLASVFQRLGRGVEAEELTRGIPATSEMC